MRSRLTLGDGARPAALALIAPNTPALVVGLFAIWRLGATAVPLNARLREHELRQILADAEPAALVSVAAHQGYSFRELVAHLLPELPSLRACLFVDPSGVVEERLSVPGTQSRAGGRGRRGDSVHVRNVWGAEGRTRSAQARARRRAAASRRSWSCSPRTQSRSRSRSRTRSGSRACTRACAPARQPCSSSRRRRSARCSTPSPRTNVTVLHGSPRLFSSLLDAAPEGLPGIRTGFVAGSASPPGLLERLDARRHADPERLRPHRAGRGLRLSRRRPRPRPLHDGGPPAAGSGAPDGRRRAPGAKPVRRRLVPDRGSGGAGGRLRPDHRPDQRARERRRLQRLAGGGRDRAARPPDRSARPPSSASATSRRARRCRRSSSPGRERSSTAPTCCASRAPASPGTSCRTRSTSSPSCRCSRRASPTGRR